MPARRKRIELRIESQMRSRCIRLQEAVTRQRHGNSWTGCCTYITHARTFLALVIGVRIASTITISSGLSRTPAKAPAEADRCEPIISIRRAASMAVALVPRSVRANLRRRGWGGGGRNIARMDMRRRLPFSMTDHAPYYCYTDVSYYGEK